MIERNPFRIAFRQGNGAGALSEVRNGKPAPLVEPPTVDPVPPGTDNRSTVTLYAPLAFLVGSETLRQYKGLVWGGNPMSGMRAGVWYSARSVIGASVGGNGVRLALSTTDPSRRKLLLTVRPGGNGTIVMKIFRPTNFGWDSGLPMFSRSLRTRPMSPMPSSW